MNRASAMAFKAILVFTSLLGTMALSGTANAATQNIDWDKVVSYAHKYACNAPNGTCRNKSYPFYGADCTNFVSQALYYGGMPMERHSAAAYWKSEWYFDHSDNSHSKAWSVVTYMQNYVVTQKDIASFKRPSSMAATYTPAAPGDLYMYNWGRGEGWSHLSMSTGWGTFADYKDPRSGVRYRSITGGAGDYISQHVSDRDYAPWNFGYQTEKNPKVRVNMDTLVIHFNR